MRRFRLLDWHTRWFWLLIFYRKQYGEPAWQIETFRPSARDRERGLFVGCPNRYGWGWEDEPPRSGQLEARQPPTIGELEALLTEDETPCTVHPDGSVTW